MKKHFLTLLFLYLTQKVNNHRLTWLQTPFLVVDTTSQYSGRLNIHNWMTHSWQFTDSFQLPKAPMRGKSSQTQIESSIVTA